MVFLLEKAKVLPPPPPGNTQWRRKQLPLLVSCSTRRPSSSGRPLNVPSMLGLLCDNVAVCYTHYVTHGVLRTGLQAAAASCPRPTTTNFIQTHAIRFSNWQQLTHTNAQGAPDSPTRQSGMQDHTHSTLAHTDCYRGGNRTRSLHPHSSSQHASAAGSCRWHEPRMTARKPAKAHNTQKKQPQPPS